MNAITRPIIMRIRVNNLERERIHCLARREGMNASEFVRQVIREAAKARGMSLVGAPEILQKEYPMR